jgi:hypothetical protein
VVVSVVVVVAAVVFAVVVVASVVVASVVVASVVVAAVVVAAVVVVAAGSSVLPQATNAAAHIMIASTEASTLIMVDFIVIISLLKIFSRCVAELLLESKFMIAPKSLFVKFFCQLPHSNWHFRHYADFSRSFFVVFDPTFCLNVADA